MKKKILGQYFTKHSFWLKKHIVDFIRSTKTSIAFDPFAGDGDLLKILDNLGYKRTVGFDIDPNLGWKINDSLLNIPRIKKFYNYN